MEEEEETLLVGPAPSETTLIGPLLSARDLRLIGTATALELGKPDAQYISVKARISSFKADALYQVRDCFSRNNGYRVFSLSFIVSFPGMRKRWLHEEGYPCR